MSRNVLRTIALCGASALVLAGCEDGSGLDLRPSGAEAAGEQAPQTVIREVERADIFGATELALWDGRPSLGGQWVAHPDVKDPERVRIRNTTNGQTINGALFRRERINPGPRIQVSSDAAAALGMLAGQPTELEVVVIRTEEVVIAPPPAPDAELEAPAEAGAETGTGAPDGAETAAAAAVAGGAVVATAAEEAPRRKGFWSRFRDSLRNDPEPAVEEIGTSTLAATADDASVPEVETAPLSGTVAVAAAAIAEAEAEEQKATSSEPAPRPESAVRNPYIQIGLFGEQANASAAAASLRQAGIVPTLDEGRNGNGTFWRVLVGPVTNATEQAELLAQIRGMGYADAFLTAN